MSGYVGLIKLKVWKKFLNGFQKNALLLALLSLLFIIYNMKYQTEEAKNDRKFAEAGRIADFGLLTYYTEFHVTYNA